MLCNKKIKVFVPDGFDVEGAITYLSALDIIVKITKPFQNLSTSLHIPDFAQSDNSFELEYGLQLARELLVGGLFKVGKYVKHNMKQFQEKYGPFRKQIDELVYKLY